MVSSSGQSASGTPKRVATIWNDSSSATSTKSWTSPSRSPSTSRAQVCSIIGVMRFTWPGVKAWLTSLRWRVWSGGSWFTKIRRRISSSSALRASSIDEPFSALE